MTKRHTRKVNIIPRMRAEVRIF